MKVTILVLLVTMLAGPAARAAAQNAAIRVEVRSAGSPIAGASIVVNGAASQTDDRGVASADVMPGRVEIVVAKEGFEPVSLAVDVRAGESRTIPVDLQPQSEIAEHVTVSATRTERGIEDEPMRVEVLDRDEIEEKLMMTPGDIVMMLNEMGGLRVQATSPSLGAASVRIQGMRGRYTRFLFDGLPLSGEQVGSFGLLQVPPVDLGRVEVIKGVASSLYGAGAMGGVVNLVSRRPGAKPEAQLLVNRSSRGATDVAFWQAAPVTDGWSFALLASANGQQRIDIDGDGWADLPMYGRAVVRPRAFWDNKEGRSFFATAGMTLERRTGGTMPRAVLAATGQRYVEALETGRLDAGASLQTLVRGASVFSVRGSVTNQQLHHFFGETVERDRHATAFAEATLRRTIGRHTLVGGIAMERDAYHPIDLPQFAYTFTVPGVFVQDDADLVDWLAISASARLDAHSEYGAFLSPRVAGLMKFRGWTSRLSYGTGFFASTPLTEETEAAGLSRLTIIAPLEAERGRSGSWDVSRSIGSVSTTLTLFASTVRDPVDVERDDRFVLRNLTTKTTNSGVEALAIWRREGLSVVANYTYVRAHEGDEEVPLTPRHNVGVDGMWEWPNGAGRLGLEWYYTGVQRLEANPYRQESQPYNIFGILVEKRIRRVRVFVNGENLTNVRQTRWDPLLRPARASDGRWTVDAWAPLDGRNVNGGIRWSF
jgi:outer membrane receptor for ferrienterochelin and colicins